MILVTGCAGFIGFHTAKALLGAGWRVVGVDNVNDYYDVRLKEARLAQLLPDPQFTFVKADINDAAAVLGVYLPDITHIIHLAAQAGVRYSVTHPLVYGHSNLMGHLHMLEFARACPRLAHFMYASSSSVYGNRAAQILSVGDTTDKPVSLYAATKKAGELMSESYAHLYGLPATGLRFFTVYGPYGRPDMAYYSFAEAMTHGLPITVYGNGELKRDFTYISDVVNGIIALIPHVPKGHRLLNYGNNKPETVNMLVNCLEVALGVQAIINHKPREESDVEETYADITATAALCGYAPRVTLHEGIKSFVDWYKHYNSA